LWAYPVDKASDFGDKYKVDLKTILESEAI
jgi:hypothetical protein